MRKGLADKAGERKKFKAIFCRFGKKINYNGYSSTTVLLTNIIDVETSLPVTDHLWFSYTKGLESLKLTEGIRITFDARVKEYLKGYVNKKYGINQRQRDFKLSHPTNFRIYQGDGDQ